jgi:hypothetical protein
MSAFRRNVQGLPERSRREGPVRVLNRAMAFRFLHHSVGNKLDECGVFGVSSNEYLNYAMKNRQEGKTRVKSLYDMLKNKVRHTNCEDSGDTIYME